MLEYLESVFEEFPQGTLIEMQWFESVDGSTVFVEAAGNLLHGATGTVYRNVYVFKVVVAEGYIGHAHGVTPQHANRRS